MATVVSGGDEPKKTPNSLPVPKAKRGLRSFFNEVGREMKKVSWPTRTETNRLTGVVLAVCSMLVVFLTSLSVLIGIVIDLITKGKI